MNDNVVPLFRPKNTVKKVPVGTDMTGLIIAVTNWAEEQGVDVSSDIGFQIRCADFMAYLQILAKEGDKKFA